MTSNNDLRIRLDDTFTPIIDELRLSPFFPDLSAVILFCAALGHSKGIKRQGRGLREVRLMVLLSHHGAYELFNALSLAADEMHTLVDPLAEEHTPFRAKLMEEYANGGLSILKAAYEAGKPISILIPQLVSANFLGEI